MESNIGLFVTYSVSLLIMIALPVALAFFAVKRLKASWWVILVGVVTYIVSQMLYYPVLQKVSALFNDGKLPMPSTEWLPLFNAVILGFLVALFEESARYFGLLFIKRKIKKVKAGIALGIGHGGFESLALALWPIWPIFGGVLFQFFNIVFYNAGAQLAKGVSSEEVQYYLSYFAQFWTNPWHLGLLYGVKAVINLSIQILVSVLVWKAVRNRNFGWFALAFFYHMLVTGIAVYLSYIGWGYWAVNGILAIFMLANIYLINYFWKEESDRLKAESEIEALEEGEVEEDIQDDEDYEDEDEDAEYDDDEEEFDDEEEDDEEVEEESSSTK